jgi:sugar O-acyltransferase (sialic acid O-acetyltransferase NeuD family)
VKVDLYIFGTGELAKIAFSYFFDSLRYNLKGFIVDDDFFSQEISLFGKPVLKYSESLQLLLHDNVETFVAISASRMNRDREGVFAKLDRKGVTFASFVSPQAFISNSASIGRNVFIFEHNVIQNGVSIGDNTILWSGNHIGHQTSIGAHNFISSHVVISGYCALENNCYIGVNSTIIDHIKISNGTLVGAASLIIKDTEENSVYVGSPAKKIPGKDPFQVKLG